ncbi:MAG: hypothetical protein AAF572_28715 [Cyanobacteria bacterium P01_B01_bin.77]
MAAFTYDLAVCLWDTPIQHPKDKQQSNLWSRFPSKKGRLP